ncbi:MAG: trypsin-like peptidase domain-containing protein [Alphaproteobacteria bacterium]|nr:trypsin-like peptidase domain-containing protein [Alphaproteobacteria bacterium]
MANPKYLLKTEFFPSSALVDEGVAVVEQHDRLVRFLEARGGRDIAGLFAKPLVSRGNDVQAPSISWYSEVAGEPVALTRLSAAERASAGEVLRARLTALQPLLDDPSHGALLARALIVPRLDDVLRIGDSVVLIHWGLVPPGLEAGVASLNAHFAATLGGYAPFKEPVREPVAQVPPASPVLPSPIVAAPVSRRPAQAPAGRRPVAWAAVVLYSLLIVLAVAALALTAGYYLGWRALVADLHEYRAPPTDGAVIENMIAAQRAINEGLKHQIAEAEAILGRNQCTADNPTGMPPAPTITPVQRPATQAAPAFQGNLADLLDRSVVLVLAETKEGSGFGTGFVIAPDLIATNAHVVEHALPGRIMVTSKALNGVRPAELVVETRLQGPFDADFAVLRVAGLSQLTVLELSTRAERLEPVVAAGFPGVVMKSDETFRRLLNGDSAAAPEANLTSGEVNSIQSDTHGSRIIHTAAIARGNSGGPLTDRCGRVVGINTLMTLDASQLARGTFAQASSSLLEFLKANNLPGAVTDAPCQPQAPVPVPTTTPAPARP